MLPAILVTLITFLLELSNSSPVYNMQPAFITTNIGLSTGRNIRNLPCISRKTSQSGVCMFAIDCLKANGTHLGTCIDRFYFGSCCHIEPVHDIIENTIDTDLIPSREPPQRLASTISTSSTLITTAVPTIINVSSSTSLNKFASSTSSSPDTTITTTSLKPSTTTSSNKRTTAKPIITTTTTSTTTFSGTTETEKLQTFQSVDGITNADTTTKPIKIVTKVTTTTKPSRKPGTTSKVPALTTKAPSTTTVPLTTIKIPLNITRGQTSTPRVPLHTTKVPLSTSRIPLHTTRAPFTTSKAPASRPTSRPKPVRVTTESSSIKPSKKPSKPNKPTTSKPTNYSSSSTKRPTKGTTTVRPSKRPGSTFITRPPLSSTTSITRKPTTSSTGGTSKLPTRKPISTTTNQSSPPVKSTVKIKITTPSTLLTTTTAVPSTSTIKIANVTGSPPKVNLSTIFESVNGNLATNEIEAGKPTTDKLDGSSIAATTSTATTTAKTTSTTAKPSLVTWTVADNINRNSSSNATTYEGENTTDWVPITTPDGWVLLPSVTTAAGSTATISTQPPIVSTITTEQITTLGRINLTTIANTKPPENTTKPSTTYIPLETATISTSTISTTTGEVPVTEKFTTNITETPNLDNATDSVIRPVNMSDFTDVCGRRMFPEARIVGGEKSPFGRWPWQISLRQWRTSTYLHKCGAALLNENWAITAAHCVDNVPPSDLLLRLGEHDLSTESEPYLHQERRVQIVASHPQFDPRTFEYDLALLRFYEPVTFQPNILPVCVPQNDDNFVGRTAYVTGWGRLYEDGPLPSVLQEVSVPVINNTVCESMYRSAGYIEHIPHIFICAGWRRGGFDSCEGDSGGPMVIQREDKRFLLAGVISWGIGCAEPNQPGVYTRISEFRDWINQILQF